jgi:hypothetical protein
MFLVIDHQMCHRDLLETDFNKVWGQGRVGLKWFQGLFFNAFIPH